MLAKAEGPTLAPKPDQANSALNVCISDTANFKAEGQHAFFIVVLENKCEQRVKCEVYANIRTARGRTRGHSTVVLAARSAGAEAMKLYTLRVKVAGGMAQVEHNCKVF